MTKQTSTIPSENQLLPEAQANEILNVAKGTLAVWRSTGRVDLPYIKIGKNVRYRYGDIMDFIDRHTKTQCIGKHDES